MALQQKLVSKTRSELKDTQSLEFKKIHLSFNRRIDKILNGYEVKARLLTLIPKFNEWILAEPELPEYKSPSIREEGVLGEQKKHEKVFLAVLLKHEQWAISNPLRGSVPREDRFENNLDALDALDAEWHKRTIFKYNSDVKTQELKKIIRDLLSEIVDTNSLMVSSKSTEKFEDSVLNYLAHDYPASNVFLDYSLPTQANEEDIVQTGKNTLEAIKTAQLYVNDLNDYLTESVNDIDE